MRLRDKIAAFLVAAILAIGYCVSARADGLPTKGRATDETTWSQTAAKWTGLWVAGTVGYSVQTTDISTIDISVATKDWTYGIGGGFDYQLTGTNIVLGVGVDISWTNASSMVASWDRQWSVWGRGGVLLTPHVLGYLGVGYTELSGSFAIPGFADKRGLTLIGGLEAMTSSGWFVRPELRWVDLGDNSALGGTTSGQYSGMLTFGKRF
jgi:opacity protein-like surface antigen